MAYYALRLTGQTRKAGDIMANVNKDALVDAIAAKTELAKKAVEGVIDALQEKITDEIRQGNKVTLTGFGTFRVSKRAARQGINPQTKETIQIPAMTVPKFTAGKALKEAVK
jgi:nucleoid DNA-binding protein